MTHKENLKAILEVHFAGFKDELIESAVERIMQLKYEKSHDCLDREYLLQVMDDFCGPDRGATITLDTLADLVADMPSVQPGPKTGHWNRVTDKAGHLVWECDCGWQQRFATNYCPNCGTKMIEPQESEV